MSNPNLLPSMRAAVVGTIDPDAYAAGTVTTGWIAMADFETVMAIVMAGTIVATGLLDAKLQQATDASGTGVKDITGKAITQLTAAGSDSDKQAVINLHADEMDVDGGFTHVRLSMTLTTAGGDSGAVVLGFDPHFGPASDNDASTVDEIVA